MTDLILPPWLKCAKIGFRYLDSTGISRGVFGGPPKTAAKGGDRLGAHLEFTPTATSSTEAAQERRALIALLSRLRGRQNRIYISNPARKLAGSFPATELLSNNTFADGTTGWQTNSIVALTVNDRVCRASIIANEGSTFGLLGNSAAASVVQYAPYVLRAMTQQGRGQFDTDLGLRFGSGAFGVDYGTSTGLSSGLISFAITAPAATMFIGLIRNAETGPLVGDYIEVPYISLSRCAQVDNGLNAMTRSDELDHADWTKVQSSVTANVAVAPDGASTADALVENTAVSVVHTLGPTASPTRTSQAEDLVVYGHFKRGAGTRDIQLRVGSDVSNFSHCIFNLGAGTAGSVTNNGTATNGRAFIKAMGNGWYLCYVVARAAASTTIYKLYSMVNAGSNTYTGDGTSSVYCWRLGCARSSVPCRPVQTVATALPTGTAQALSGGLYIKGLPASTNGLLLPSDEYQIGNELHICEAALNSDAGGLGFLQGNPAMRAAPADNAPVIIHEPMGYFLFNGDAVGWEHEPGILTNASAELEEAA